ncbi:MAG: hypothetical protein GXY50_10580 [Syntrophomonadaceae bacterium]|nr:hypothetical protein [Syntrophomonadaceae bacterium]
MTFKQFLTRSMIITVFGLLLIVLFTSYVNEFALIGDAAGLKREPVSRDWERWAKYLYTYNYIPANFEGVIWGPSLADNLDPALFENLKVYNASINGGNFTELRIMAESIVAHNRKVKFFIICLDPYLTKDSGRKTSYLSRKDYWSALGSVDLYRYYYDKIVNQYRGTRNYYNEYGHYDFNRYKDKQDVEQAIAAALTKSRKWGTDQFKVTEQAKKDLKAIIDLAHANEIKVFAYYYPRPYEIYDQKREFYEEMHQDLDPLFDSSDYVWDFNTPEYEFFTREHSNYCDHCHLSRPGAVWMVREIEKQIAGRV